MELSSLGTAGRSAKITVDYKKGFINQHEEIFELGVNTGVLGRPNNRTYEFQGETYDGKNSMAEAIKNNPGIGEAILDEVKIPPLS